MAKCNEGGRRWHKHKKYRKINSQLRQENIDSLNDSLAAAENRLQALFDAQEKEAFSPERQAAAKSETATERVSVKKNLAEMKAKAATRNLPEKEKGRKSPGMNMEK